MCYTQNVIKNSPKGQKVEVLNMALNLKRKIDMTFPDLINDAVERKDLDALNFLETERNKKVKRLNKKGIEVDAHNAIPSIRSAYLEKFYGIIPKVESSAFKRDMNALEAAKAKMAALANQA
jgi:hypothetical protein